MFMTIGFDRFFSFLPTFDLGKLWSFFRVKQPVRPLTDQERAARFHYVTVDGKAPVRPDDLMGEVYITADQKVIYWSDEDHDPKALGARYVDISPEQLLNGGQNGAVRWENTRVRDGIIESADREQLLCDYYGKEKGLALFTPKLG